MILKGVLNQAISVTPPPETADPFWGNVVALLRFDGDNDSTVIIDETGKKWTANNGAKITTTAPLTGYGSLLLNGIGTPDNGQSSVSLDGICNQLDDFYFAANDFTVECTIQANALPSAGDPNFRSANLVSQENVGLSGSQFVIQLEENASIRATFNSATSAYAIESQPSAIIVGQKYHIAFVRSGNLFMLFINGQLAASAEHNITLRQSLTRIEIGAQTSGEVGSETSIYGFNGLIDEVRITKGVARYIEDFSPPSQPHLSHDSPKVIAWTETEFSTVISQSRIIPQITQDGDLLVACIMHRDTLTAPSGWSLAESAGPVSGSGVNQYTSIYTKKASSTDAGASVTFTQATSQRMATHIIVVRGDNDKEVQVANSGNFVDTTTSTTVSNIAQVAATDSNQLAIATSSWINALTSEINISDPSCGWTETGTSTLPADTVTNNAVRMGTAYQLISSPNATIGTFTRNGINGGTGYGSATIILEQVEAQPQTVDLVSLGSDAGDVWMYYHDGVETTLSDPSINTGGQAQNSAFNPDKSLLMYSCTTNAVGSKIYEVNDLDLTEVLTPHSQVTGTALGRDWHPNGQAFAVGSNGGDYVYAFTRNPDNTFTLATPPLTKPLGSVFSVSWHPNGNYVAMCGGVLDRAYVYLYQWDGSKLVHVSASQVNTESGSYCRTVKWSPDGNYLVALINRAGLSDKSPDIAICSFNGSNLSIGNLKQLSTLTSFNTFYLYAEFIGQTNTFYVTSDTNEGLRIATISGAGVVTWQSVVPQTTARISSIAVNEDADRLFVGYAEAPWFEVYDILDPYNPVLLVAPTQIKDIATREISVIKTVIGQISDPDFTTPSPLDGQTFTHSRVTQAPAESKVTIELTLWWDGSYRVYRDVAGGVDRSELASGQLIGVLPSNLAEVQLVVTGATATVVTNPMATFVDVSPETKTARFELETTGGDLSETLTCELTVREIANTGNSVTGTFTVQLDAEATEIPFVDPLGFQTYTTPPIEVVANTVAPNTATAQAELLIKTDGTYEISKVINEGAKQVLNSGTFIDVAELNDVEVIAVPVNTFMFDVNDMVSYVNLSANRSLVASISSGSGSSDKIVEAELTFRKISDPSKTQSGHFRANLFANVKGDVFALPFGWAGGTYFVFATQKTSKPELGQRGSITLVLDGNGAFQVRKDGLAAGSFQFIETGDFITSGNASDFEVQISNVTINGSENGPTQTLYQSTFGSSLNATWERLSIARYATWELRTQLNAVEWVNISAKITIRSRIDSNIVASGTFNARIET